MWTYIMRFIRFRRDLVVQLPMISNDLFAFFFPARLVKSANFMFM